MNKTIEQLQQIERQALSQVNRLSLVSAEDAFQELFALACIGKRAIDKRFEREVKQGNAYRFNGVRYFSRGCVDRWKEKHARRGCRVGDTFRHDL